MSEYRHRETGEIKTQGQWRADHPNTSLPKVWTNDTLDFLNVDPVQKAPLTSMPEVGPYQELVRDGARQQDSGMWVENWIAQDMFSAYTDDEGVTHTKEEQEAEYQAELDNFQATRNREKRDDLISKTDWWAMPDSPTMTAEQTAYRQALRDITSHANWPHLEDADWPTKP